MGSAEEWQGLLDLLDRNSSSGQLSPDVAPLTELMATYHVPGVSIAATEEDGSSWAAGFGTATDRSVFQACSISKHVAAFGSLRLVDQGILDLDADIHDYLTSWQLPSTNGWRPQVTLRQLLAHTAGLSANWFPGYLAGEPTPSTVQTLRGEPPANTPPVRATLLPGSRFRYSGSHYAVLQQLLVDVTGEPFDELLRALVLEPVGMLDSSFDQRFPYERGDLVARGHHVTGTPVPGGWRTIPEMAGAGLWTTPSDLVRLELALLQAVRGASTLLSKDLATQMVTPQVPGGYGLGTQVDESPGHRRFGHTGGNVGYGCLSFAWPDSGAAMAAMANAEGAGEVLVSILSAAQRRYATPPTAAAPDDLAGRYLVRDDYPIDIAIVDGKLTMTAPDQPSAVLVPLSSGRYRHPGLDLDLTFRTTDEGRPAVEIRQEHESQTASRVVTQPVQSGGGGVED